jgi:replicative DNA helicase
MRRRLDFIQLVKDGMAGKNVGLHNGLDKLNKYLYKTQKATYYAIGGMPGSGKSAFTDDNFVLSPYLFYKNQGAPLNVKWFYYSFEISEEAKRAKWTAYKLWNDFRIKIDPAILMGKDENLKITNHDFNKIVSVDDFMSEMMYDYMDFIQDPLNPTGILHDIEKYMLSIGKLEKEPYIKSDGTPGERIVRYIPNDPDHHVIVIVDHVALTKEERGFNTKQNIDKLSEYMRYLRNLYKITPVLVCQFNKGLSGVERQKLAKANHDDLAPILEDFKDTGNIGQDANVAIGLFNPAKYNIQEYAGYDISQMPSSFRSVHLMKNRDGAEYFTVGMHFSGGIGMLRELPPADLFEAGIMDYKNYQ